MQEDGSVGWDPIAITYNPSLESKLFVLYLMGVSIILVVRLITLLKQVRALQPAGDRFFYLWQVCASKVGALRRLALVTLLLSVLIAVNGTVRMFVKIQETRAAGLGAIAGGIAEVGRLFEMGLAVCVALYAVASIYQGMLERRKAAWNNAQQGIKSDSAAG